VDYRT